MDHMALVEIVKSRLPFFGPIPTMVEGLEAKLGSLGVAEIKKELSDIEENANQNLDIVIEALEDLQKSFEEGRKELQEKFTDFVKINNEKKLILISNEKFNELSQTAASLKVTNKQATEVNKKAVKESLTHERDLKTLKEKCDELTRELAAVKERESIK
jgi:hypothetical protein